MYVKVCKSVSRCIEQGLGFYRPPFSRKPYFEMQCTGEKVILREENGCAYIDDKESTCSPYTDYEIGTYTVAPGRIIPGSSSDGKRFENVVEINRAHDDP